MKIELKHLAPYLPYGLNIECHSKKEIKQQGSYISIMTCLHEDGIDDNFGNNWDLTVRPILRPLSDLTKEIEVNGEKFVPIEKYNYLIRLREISKYKGGQNILRYIQVREQDVLLELHFDVFGLIPQGLAIDINTI